MNMPVKQHLIDPEICIRCYTCEAACPIGAIEHDDRNVVVKAESCNFCMACVPVCPTGSIDEWRIVEEPYSLADQYGWTELPAQAEVNAGQPATETTLEAFDDAVAAHARRGAFRRRRKGEGARERLQAVGQYVHARQARGGDRSGQLSPDGRRGGRGRAPHHPRFRRPAFPGARRPEPRDHSAGRGQRAAGRICRGSIRFRALATASARTSTTCR